ncbi:hypothetical protein EHS25_002538 [Saitozyma podzolica]|uniref:Histone deacetylase domain-containing protein n=1 Tax=Saitozyma podzolica TaxID=1890683 RepID=A0A427YCT0_9TREE|nr:hypothetical protein EHS25_002538 [Saitozyma podzolica]
MSDSPLVAYIWSQTLQEAADQLPYNLDRSTLVHDLIRSLDLLDGTSGSSPTDEHGEGDSDRHEDEETALHLRSRSIEKGKGNLRSRARVIEPDMSLGTAQSLRRYHDSDYVEFVLRESYPQSDDELGDEAGAEAEAKASGSDAGSASSAEYRPKKRRREVHGLEHDCPPFPLLRDYALQLASATQTACRLVASGKAHAAVCWDGGRHHALRSRASGFCYVADAVLGIMLLTKEGRVRVRVDEGIPGGTQSSLVQNGQPNGDDELEHEQEHKHGDANKDEQKDAGQNCKPDSTSTPKTGRGAGTRAGARARARARVMYLDLDLHYGDGVAQAPDPLNPPLLADLLPPATPHSGLPSPDTPNPFTLSIPLAAYPSASTYAAVFPSVNAIREAYRPDYVVLQLGADGLPHDRVGQYGAWSVDGPGGMLWVVDKVIEWGVPVVVLGGGGYNHPNTARAWARVTAKLLGEELTPDTEVPHHDHFAEYAPSFTLEVSESGAKDENKSQDIDKINETFNIIASRIGDIVAAHA